MTATNNRMFERLDEIDEICRIKFASFGNICIVCPVLFESVQNWTTQRFTITKKIACIEANCK